MILETTGNLVEATEAALEKAQTGSDSVTGVIIGIAVAVIAIAVCTIVLVSKNKKNK